MNNGDEMPGVTVRPAVLDGLDVHSAGCRIDVAEGLLYVLDKSGSILAAYAPGMWIAAKLGSSGEWREASA